MTIEGWRCPFCDDEYTEGNYDVWVHRHMHGMGMLVGAYVDGLVDGVREVGPEEPVEPRPAPPINTKPVGGSWPPWYLRPLEWLWRRMGWAD
jgi:hypothetical protein